MFNHLTLSDMIDQLDPDTDMEITTPLEDDIRWYQDRLSQCNLDKQLLQQRISLLERSNDALRQANEMLKKREQ